MVFNATYHNISVMSWQSVLFVVETGENHRPAASHWQTLFHLAMSGIQTHNFSDCKPLIPQVNVKKNNIKERRGIFVSLSKYTHFFLFIFWWHQIFSFPFCFSLLVFPTLQWYLHIICSRENHHEKNISRYVAPPHNFQSVVLPT
jgi:hypothetical protein